MMSFNLYSVYDAVKHEFSLPFAANSDIEALRMFYVQMSSVQLMRSCEKDFDLYLVGYYDTKSNEIESDPELIVEGTDFIFRYEKGEFNDVED